MSSSPVKIRQSKNFSDSKTKFLSSNPRDYYLKKDSILDEITIKGFLQIIQDGIPDYLTVHFNDSQSQIAEFKIQQDADKVIVAAFNNLHDQYLIDSANYSTYIDAYMTTNGIILRTDAYVTPSFGTPGYGRIAANAIPVAPVCPPLHMNSIQQRLLTDAVKVCSTYDKRRTDVFKDTLSAIEIIKNHLDIDQLNLISDLLTNRSITPIVKYNSIWSSLDTTYGSTMQFIKRAFQKDLDNIGYATSMSSLMNVLDHIESLVTEMKKFPTIAAFTEDVKTEIVMARLVSIEGQSTVQGFSSIQAFFERDRAVSYSSLAAYCREQINFAITSVYSPPKNQQLSKLSHSFAGSSAMESFVDQSLFVPIPTGYMTTLNQQQPAGICYAWQKRGSCIKGDTCRYQHIVTNDSIIRQPSPFVEQDLYVKDPSVLGGFRLVTKNRTRSQSPSPSAKRQTTGNGSRSGTPLSNNGSRPGTPNSGNGSRPGTPHSN